MRLFNKRLIVIVGLLVVVAAGTTAFALNHFSTKTNPPWVGNVACRESPMTHVHDPGRLTVMSKCATVTGTVKKVQLVAAYDDLKITIVPDAHLLGYLKKANNGVVVADIIATDQASVTIPPVDSRITAWGTWVLDKATKTTQLLPTYQVTVQQLHATSNVVSGASSEKHGPPPRRQLQLSVKAPNRVPVGGRIDVTFQARWLQDRLLKPASQIRLFTEITDSKGSGVRWKATMTHTNGAAVIHLVAIQVPAAYTLTVYAAPSGQAVSASTAIEVTKT